MGMARSGPIPSRRRRLGTTGPPLPDSSHHRRPGAHWLGEGGGDRVRLSPALYGDALQLVQPGDVIITPKLDRCFRSALDALDVLQKLKERGVALHMIDFSGDVTGNGISKLLFTILSAVAEAERDRMRERIFDVKQDQRQWGRYLGGGKVPFGYRVTDDGALIEARRSRLLATREMVALRSQGAPLRAVAAHMTARGFPISHNAAKEITRRAQELGGLTLPY